MLPRDPKLEALTERLRAARANLPRVTAAEAYAQQTRALAGSKGGR